MNSDFTRAVMGNVWLGAMAPRETIPKEVAIVLLGTVVENGISSFLEISKKNGFSEGDSRLILLQVRQSINEADLLESEYFRCSLQMGLANEIIVMEKLSGKYVGGVEGFALMATRLCEIFPKPVGIVESLLNVLKMNLPKYVGKDKEWWGKTFKAHHDERERILTAYWGKIPSSSRPKGTDTRMVPCPKCGWEKRCDAGTKRFCCKNPKGCDFDKPFSEVVQK